MSSFKVSAMHNKINQKSVNITQKEKNEPDVIIIDEVTGEVREANQEELHEIKLENNTEEKVSVPPPTRSIKNGGLRINKISKQSFM
jgi:hypothetical protein